MSRPGLFSDEELHAALARFGLAAFRPGQLDAIHSIINGADVVCVRPTGSGKSLIFQLAALLLGGVTVVISPLIALMADQVSKLREVGLPVVLINSRIGVRERRAALAQLTALDAGALLVYCGPETLATPDVAAALAARYAAGQVRRIMVDEAHVVGTWGGSGFRKHYQLAHLRDDFRGVPVACFSATLPLAARAYVAKQLRLRAHVTHAVSLNRPNIYYCAREILGGQFNGARSALRIALDALAFFLGAAPAPAWLPLTEAHRGGRGCANDPPCASLLECTHEQTARGSGIIYCHARKTCEELAAQLLERGYRAAYYHAEMPAALRRDTFDGWMAGALDVVCATSALGMGVDKRNVRFVVDFDMSAGVAECAQETGRAGRDGLPACALVLHSLGRKNAWRFQLQGKGAADAARPQLLALDRLYNLLTGSACRRTAMLRALDDESDVPDQALCCDACTRAGERALQPAVPKHARPDLAALDIWKRFRPAQP
jgi:superfamily II DNA helicase RecQ